MGKGREFEAVVEEDETSFDCIIFPFLRLASLYFLPIEEINYWLEDWEFDMF